MRSVNDCSLVAEVSARSLRSDFNAVRLGISFGGRPQHFLGSGNFSETAASHDTCSPTGGIRKFTKRSHFDEVGAITPTALTIDRSPRSGCDGSDAVVVVREEGPGVEGLADNTVELLS
jgi:hypothetical protein